MMPGPGKPVMPAPDLDNRSVSSGAVRSISRDAIIVALTCTNTATDQPHLW